MKSIRIVKLSLLSLIVVSPVTPPAPAGSATLGVFAASSPCDAVSRPALKIPETADCELIKWHLTLHHDPSTLAPTTYKLNYVYGSPEQGTTGLSQGGTEIERKGRWAIVRGTKTDPAAVVYQLDPDKPRGSLFLLKADDNILLFLDEERNLLVGNGDFSYTLNRAKNILKN